MKKGHWMALAIAAGLLAIVVGTIAIGAVIFMEKMGRQAKRQAMLAREAKWETAQAEAAVLGLRNAIKQYQIQYSVYPLDPGQQGLDTAMESPRKSDQFLMDILLGEDEELNPRRIAFGEWRAADKSKTNGLLTQGADSVGILVDPWGEQFNIALDGNYDNKIDNPDKENGSTPTLRQSILVWSGGPDRDNDTWEDNIKSW